MTREWTVTPRDRESMTSVPELEVSMQFQRFRIGAPGSQTPAFHLRNTHASVTVVYKHRQCHGAYYQGRTETLARVSLKEYSTCIPNARYGVYSSLREAGRCG